MSELLSPIGNSFPVAKRGRPSKTAAVYDENGTLILNEEQRARLNEIVEGIKHDGEKILKLCISTGQKYFEMGKILFEAEKKTIGNMTASKYEELTGIPARMVSKAMKIYKNFANNPEAIEGLTMREIVLLIAEKKSTEEIAGTPIQYSLPQNQEGLSEEDFGLPTASGIDLQKYRLHTDSKNGKFYLLQKGFSNAIPIASLTVEQPKNAEMEDAYKNLLNETQIAMEKYYAVIEQEDKVNECLY